MEKEKFSYPVSLRRMQITDKFWKNEMELVQREGRAPRPTKRACDSANVKAYKCI